jgi:hypothetical protein
MIFAAFICRSWRGWGVRGEGPASRPIPCLPVTDTPKICRMAPNPFGSRWEYCCAFNHIGSKSRTRLTHVRALRHRL